MESTPLIFWLKVGNIVVWSVVFLGIFWLANREITRRQKGKIFTSYSERVFWQAKEAEKYYMGVLHGRVTPNSLEDCAVYDFDASQLRAFILSLYIADEAAYNKRLREYQNAQKSKFDGFVKTEETNQTLAFEKLKNVELPFDREKWEGNIYIHPNDR